MIHLLRSMSSCSTPRRTLKPYRANTALSHRGKPNANSRSLVASMRSQASGSLFIASRFAHHLAAFAWSRLSTHHSGGVHSLSVASAWVSDSAHDLRLDSIGRVDDRVDDAMCVRSRASDEGSCSHKVAAQKRVQPWVNFSCGIKFA